MISEKGSILVQMSDFSHSLVDSQEKLLWNREEGLSHIVESVIFEMPSFMSKSIHFFFSLFTNRQANKNASESILSTVTYLLHAK